jgi:hypothetical protein
MNHDSFARLLLSVNDCFETVLMDSNTKPYWFVAYGALLWICRDMKMGKAFNTDLDIACLSPCGAEVRQRFLEYGFKEKICVENDFTGAPLEMGFEMNGFTVDIFFWHEANGYLWHTYDYYGERKRKPSKYMFKGIPKWLVAGKTIWVVLEEIARPMPLPAQYGSLLHAWYGNWIVEDKNFGQSLGEMQVIKSCKDIPTLNPKHYYFLDMYNPEKFLAGINGVMRERKNLQ